MVGTTQALVTVVLLGVAGCLGESSPLSTPPGGPPPVQVSHVLVNVTEPLDLVAPTFKLLGKLPDSRGGEPSIWAHTDGTLYVSYPGCLTGKNCENGPVWRSNDEGASWTYLNDPTNGRLGKDMHRANGDAEVTVDANGTVYTSDLGGGIQVFRSRDQGTTWEWTSDVVKGAGGGADRQWMAAAGEGVLVMDWMDTSARQVAVRTSRDGGVTWADAKRFGATVGTLGPIHFDPSGKKVFGAFTQPKAPLPIGTNALFTSPEFELHVIRSLDEGRTWDEINTGVVIPHSYSGLHWAGSLIFPALDITGDGHVVVAWSEEIVPPGNVANTGARVRMISSGDDGKTWTAPLDVSSRSPSVLPWVTGGAGDRAVISYLSADFLSDSDRAVLSDWDVMLSVVDGVGRAGTKKVETTVDRAVHKGGVCTTGTACAISDRSLLDFFETDLMPDGRIVMTYPADPGQSTEIRTAIQTAGTPLLVRAGS